MAAEKNIYGVLVLYFLWVRKPFCLLQQFFFGLSCFQNMISNRVRTLEPLGSAGTRAPGLALVTHWGSTATRGTVCRGQRRSCAWEVADACGVPLCQGVWVRGQLLLFRFLSCLCMCTLQNLHCQVFNVFGTDINFLLDIQELSGIGFT